MIRYNIKPYHSSGLREYHVMIQHHTDINEGGIRGDGGWSLCRDITPTNFLREITRRVTYSLDIWKRGPEAPRVYYWASPIYVRNYFIRDDICNR
jgi:hypothetical protein